jgi:hypothetical protein
MEKTLDVILLGRRHKCQHVFCPKGGNCEVKKLRKVAGSVGCSWEAMSAIQFK